MGQKKVKTYVITVSRVFPIKHNLAGEPTYFINSIINTINRNIQTYRIKAHTIRSNYPLWEKRIKEVQAGKAILSLRYWDGKPYRSKQKEILALDSSSGIGIQKLVFFEGDSYCPYVYQDNSTSNNPVLIEKLANNDGLTLEEFIEWFKDYDLTKPLAIIHFTKFRYL